MPATGPVVDNTGGVAEMAKLPHDVRETTDAKDTTQKKLLAAEEAARDAAPRHLRPQPQQNGRHNLPPRLRL